MMADLSNISVWVWMVLGLIIVFIIFRFFSHILGSIVHFLMSFFWHGCITLIVLFVIYYILRSVGLL